MKIPESHYVGMILSRYGSANKDQLPLAFMTPHGDDAAFEKRKSTVDGWVNQNSRRGDPQPPDPVVLKNEPLIGFRILDCVQRMGGHKWRIEDPRGFELEISSENLRYLISEGVIDRSEILEPCIWGRGRSDNFLLPISSDLYRESTEATSLVKKNVSLRDVKLGNLITLQNGNQGRYAGKLVIVERKHNDDEETGTMERYVLIGDKEVHISSGLKVAEINDQKEWSEDEALAAARERFTKRPQDYTYYAVMILKRKSSCSTTKEKVPCGWDSGAVFHWDNKHYVIGYPHGNVFNADEISSFDWETSSKIVRNNNSSWWRTPSRFDIKDLTSKGVEPHRVKVTVTADDGFTHSFHK